MTSGCIFRESLSRGLARKRVRILAPNSGPPIRTLTRQGSNSRTRFLAWLSTFSQFQVDAVWTWWNWLETHVAPGKQVLKINLDETSVRFYYRSKKGLFFPSKRKGKGLQRPRHKTSKGDQRKALTHVGLICNSPEVQVLLPQVILGNCHTLPARRLPELQAKCRPNVHLWRLKSSWITKTTFVKIAAMLGKALAPVLDKYQPILLLDAHRVHISKEGLRSLSTHHIWPIVVPASTTWLMQPLDTHCFARYKQFLRSRYTHIMGHKGHAAFSVDAVVCAVNDCCLNVLQGIAWEYAFTGNGFGDKQQNVRLHLLDELDRKSLEFLTPKPISYSQLCCCFPHKADIPIDALFSDLLPSHKYPEEHVPPSSQSPLPAASLSWADRLRPRKSRSFVHTADSDAQAFDVGPDTTRQHSSFGRPGPTATCCPIRSLGPATLATMPRLKRLPPDPHGSQ